MLSVSKRTIIGGAIGNALFNLLLFNNFKFIRIFVAPKVAPNPSTEAHL